MSKLKLVRKALKELGPKQLGLYAVYQAALRSGYLRWRTPVGSENKASPPGRMSHMLKELPSREALADLLPAPEKERLIAEAWEICTGQVRLFGGPPVPLRLGVDAELEHWTAYDSGLYDPGLNSGPGMDIKWIWEPARFGWAYTLARAYWLTDDERYPQAFWQHTETFLENNPPNLGPNWASAQEVSLRLIALSFGWQVFAGSEHSTPERASRLAAAVVAHAQRIPPSLAYARAQNNNHLLSEAAGLFTAGMALPEHPAAAEWRTIGWRWFQRGLQSQIAPDGAYMQHSTNYHRLMLQLALWMHRISAGDPAYRFPPASRQRLGAAVRWLQALLDRESGRVPNLGPNDGAYILPLTGLPFHDYRPVLQAAGETFLGEKILESGPWDEMALWLAAPNNQAADENLSSAPLAPTPLSPPHTIRLAANRSWAYLRAVRFTTRPGHADQLHLDLWWRGLNVAQDAGTYLYNAPSPWDNRLAQAAVHNTLTVAGQDQMTRAGRFLYLDRAQGQVLQHDWAEDGAWERLVVQHDGYRRLGVLHRRTVTAERDERWTVEDHLLPVGSATATLYPVRLHWLLPDWPWELGGNPLCLDSPYGWIELSVSAPVEAKVQLARAGKLLYGEGEVEPVRGWLSRTYGYKKPALSFSVQVQAALPFNLKSEWAFPED